MLKKIFKRASSLVISIFLLTILFGGEVSIQAIDLPSLSKASSMVDTPDENVFEQKANQSKMADEIKEIPTEGIHTGGFPDLGDDQVFPFVAGLGPN